MRIKRMAPSGCPIYNIIRCGWLFCHCGVYIGNKLGVLFVAAHNVAFGVKQNDAGNGGNAVDVGGDILGVENLLPRQGVFLYCLERVFRFVPHGYSEKIHFVGVLVVKVLDYRCFSDAGTAPACPEVYKGVFAFAYIVAQALCLAVVGYLEILEFFAYRGLGLVDESLAQGLHAFVVCKLWVCGKLRVECVKVPVVAFLQKQIVAERVVDVLGKGIGAELLVLRYDFLFLLLCGAVAKSAKLFFKSALLFEKLCHGIVGGGA